MQPRRKFVIAVDGIEGAGKSTLGRYLAWQLETTLIESDQFLLQNEGRLDYRFEAIRQVLNARLTLNRPVIIEGVRVLYLLESVQSAADYHIWVEQEGVDGSFLLKKQMGEYLRSYNPAKVANYVYSIPASELLE